MAIDGVDLVKYAQKFIGTPYVWGGNSLTNGVDCSGLVQQVFKQFGIDLPRTTYTQIGVGAPINIKGLRPGDLVFFDNDGNKTPDHVGIYMGGGKMIHAPRPGKGVEITDMTKGYYMSRFMGGRRIDGVHSVGAKASDVTPTPSLTPEELAASYGWNYAFLNANKELKGIFDKAAKETWTPEKFQAELRDTKWWKSNSETMRKAAVTKTTDPATWAAQMQAAVLQVRQLAAQMGAAVPENKINKIAESVIMLGMDENLLRDTLGQYVNFTKNGTLNGEAGMHEYTMRQFAYNMGIQLSDQAIKNQAQLVVRKLATTEDFENQIREQAKSMYPAYVDQIDGGLSVKDIADPYIQMMSHELELPYESIDLTDPTIKGAMNAMSKDNKPVGMTLTDFQNRLRSDPRWKETSAARDASMNVGLKVLKDMGLA